MKSNPEKAKVYFQVVGDKNKTAVGETPMQLTGDQLIQKIKGDKPFYLIVEKDTYDAKKVLFSELPNVEVNLDVKLKKTSAFSNFEKINSVINEIFNSQKLARSAKLDEALKEIAKVKSKAPEVGFVYELEGGIFYIKKEYKKSLSSYLEAQKINPSSIEANKMINILKSKHGLSVVKTRTPAKEDKK